MRRVLALTCVVGCYIEPDPPVVVNYAFVTSMTMPGITIQGLAGADLTCQLAAMRAQLPGTFVAWLSDTFTSAPGRLGTARGWVRTDGKPFADRVSDIIGNKLMYPLRLDESGNDVVLSDADLQTRVATGTMTNGTDGSDCTNFSGNVMGVLIDGVPDATSGAWTQRFIEPCTDAYRLYCFGTDRPNIAPLLAHDEGKLAFITRTGFLPGGGLAAADALCAGEATDAGLSGQFVAALATSGATIQSRASGGPWVRVDHVTVTSDLVRFDAPLGVTAKGEYTTDQVWIGTREPTEPADGHDDNCDDWTSTTAHGVIGDGGRSDRHAFIESSNQDCSIQRPIYCFQK